MGRSNFIHVCFFSTSKGFWVEKWDCRCEKSWFAQSTWVRQLGKFGRSDEDEEGDPEMEQSKEKISLGRVLGERQKKVFCHDSALALEITGIPRYSNTVLAVFFRTVCPCKCLSAFRNGVCNFRRPPGFGRAIDATEGNGRSDRIIEFGEGIGGF